MDTPNKLLSPRISPRPPTQMGTVADSQCDSLCHPHGLSVAHVAMQLPAVGDGVRIFLALDTKWVVGTAEHYVGKDRAAASRAQSATQRRHYRQPERENLGRGRSPRRGCVQTDQRS